MRATIERFLQDRHAATAVEYGLIVGVLSLVIVGGVGSVANSLQDVWTKLALVLDDSWK